LKILRIIAYLAIFYLYIPTVLSFFPATRKVGQNLFKYLLNTLSLMGNGFLNYLPNIVTISLIIVFTHYLLRFIKLFFGQIERGNIRFMGFYQEWAKPTYQICSIILIAVTAAIIFPYLPGFQSPAFQGISVFFGILISLGSTSIIANTIAGIVLLYTRSFQLGDYVQIEEIVGHVEDKNPFVIRIRTSKNVLVVLPNATVLNGKVTDFSLSARDTGIPLILHTTITLGYQQFQIQMV
jgi:small-conductance mechanosensitive channel